MCAGAYLAKVDLADPPGIQYRKRLEHVLRLERFWALANVLASKKDGNGTLSVSGVRDVQYATRASDARLDAGARRTDADFQLLSRQVPYGVIGIYEAVADEMRFIDRKTLTLTPDLGEVLREGFLEHTGTPKALQKAIREDGSVTLELLTEWGERAHIAAEVGEVEQKCLADALHRNPV